MRIFTLSRIITLLVNTFSVMVAANIVHGISYDNNYLTLILAALVLGILNTMLKPILVILAFPLLMVTAGLFYFFINALLLGLVGYLVPSFHVDGFGPALFGGLVISFVSMVTNFIIGKKRITLRVPDEKEDEDRKPPRKIDRDDGNGPVIDV